MGHGKGSLISSMESISCTMLFIRNCYLMAWPMWTATNRSAENPGFGSNASTACPWCIWIGIQAFTMGKRCKSAWFLMIARDAFSQAGSSMPKQPITPCSSSKKLWANLAGWQVLGRYWPIGEAQFYANKRAKNGDADSRFEDFLEENKIKHIKARVKHPQTNGKLEKWNDTYELNRFGFESFDNFMNWYNTVHWASVKRWLANQAILF